MKALITGATGFIGSRLCKFLVSQGHSIRIVSRQPNDKYTDVVVCDLVDNKLESSSFEDISQIFHLAAYTHDLDYSTKNEYLYRKINVDATLNIAKSAIEAKIKNFTYVSSVKAGSANKFENDLSTIDTPQGIYGHTKREAELKLIELFKGSTTRLEILRPALVYGPGVKGNMASMINGIKQGWFPPLPDTNNIRSMVHVDDLITALILITKHQKPENGIYIATDGVNYSSSVIYETLCSLLGKKIPKWRIPKIVFTLISLCHHSLKYKVQKLLGDEFYSSSSIQSIGFKPKFTLKDLNEEAF